jgi:hypothetical protein
MSNRPAKIISFDTCDRMTSVDGRVVHARGLVVDDYGGESIAFRNVNTTGRITQAQVVMLATRANIIQLIGYLSDVLLNIERT